MLLGGTYSDRIRRDASNAPIVINEPNHKKPPAAALTKS